MHRRARGRSNQRSVRRCCQGTSLTPPIWSAYLRIGLPYNQNKDVGLAFSGDSGTVVLRKRHTSRLDLSRVVPPAIDSYLEKAGLFRLDIERMKNADMTDGRAKEVIFDAFARNPILPRRLFPIVSGLYFDDDEQRAKFPDRTLWGLNNSFSEAVKILKPSPQTDGQLRIGRFFARTLYGRRIAGADVLIG